MRTTLPVANIKSAVGIGPTDHKTKSRDEPKIIIAAQATDIHKLHLAIPESEGIDVTDSHGYTALMILADLGDVECVGFLIDKGAKVGVQSTKEGYTALMIAADSKSRSKENTVAVLSALIGADPSAEHIDHAGANGETALMIAVQARRWNLALLLKEAGADIHKRNNDGLSALSYAAKSGDRNIVEWLLEQKGWFSREQVRDALSSTTSPLVRSTIKAALKEYPDNVDVAALKPAMAQEVSHPAPSASGQAVHSAMTVFVANNPGPNSENANALQNPAGSKKTFFPRMQTGAPAVTPPAGPTKRSAPLVPEDKIKRPVDGQNATAATRQGDPGYEEVQLPPPAVSSGSNALIARPRPGP